MKGKMEGRRVYCGEDGSLPPMAEGDYGRDGRGTWFARPPGAHLGCLQHHEVEEHPDGTITAHPSILVGYGDVEEFHGYLRRGVWSSC